MKITHKLTMDLDRYGVPGFDAVWGDRYTRELEIALYAGGDVWEIPAEAAVTVRYQKPDGTIGAYDLLPDGSAAWSISGNVVAIVLAPQTLTAPGCVILTVCLSAGDREISTFQILMNVRPAVGLEVSDSGDYWYLSGSLPQPKDAAVGELLVVDAVDAMGRVTALKTIGAPGLTAAQRSALEALLKMAAYTEDPSGAWAAFQTAFSQESVSVPATGIALSSMIVVMSSGTAKQLTATVTPENSTDTVVWTSSDETVATVVDGLVTPVGNGNCTITATAGVVSASCSVSVSGIDDLIHTTHSYTSSVTTAATCTEAGLRTYTCICGDSYTEEIPATGHDYVDDVCTVCGAAAQFYSIEWVPLAGYYKAGVLSQFNGVYHTGLVEVGDATKVRFTATHTGNHYVNFFDADRVYLSQDPACDPAEWVISFPENAAYFAVAYYSDEEDTLNVSVNADNERHVIANSCIGIDRAITNVIHGSAYTATLTSAATSVTMGGVDITATAYGDNVVTIEAVTGDVVIA